MNCTCINRQILPISLLVELSEFDMAFISTASKLLEIIVCGQTTHNMESIINYEM